MVSKGPDATQLLQLLLHFVLKRKFLLTYAKILLNFTCLFCPFDNYLLIAANSNSTIHASGNPVLRPRYSASWILNLPLKTGSVWHWNLACKQQIYLTMIWVIENHWNSLKLNEKNHQKNWVNTTKQDGEICACQDIFWHNLVSMLQENQGRADSAEPVKILCILKNQSLSTCKKS
jgi:hypothetical protein